MKIKIFQNRKVDKDYFYNEGTSNENAATTLSFELPLGYEDFEKKIVFLTESGNFWDKISDDNTYTIKNNITIFEEVDAYVWLKKDEMDFRTEQFKLNFNLNENPDFLIPDEVDTEEIGSLVDVLNLKIKEVADLKDDINNTLTQLKDYDNQLVNIEKIIKDFTDYQSKVNEQLKNEFEVKDFSGTSTYITDSAEFPMPISINGGIEQDTREGYNLFEVTGTSKTSNGIEFTVNEDKSINVVGTAVNSSGTMFLGSITLDAGTYTIYFPNMIYAWGTARVEVSSSAFSTLGFSSSITKKLITLTERATLNFNAIVPVTGTSINCIIYPMIIKGDVTANLPTYEQFGAMPSIEFPSEVKGVSGHYDNVVENKNIFDKDKIEIGKTWNGQANANRARSSLFERGTDVTISFANITGFTFARIVLTDKTKSTNSVFKSFTTDGNIALLSSHLPNYTHYVIEYEKTGINESDFENVKTQIEENTVATEIVEHQEQNYALDIPFNMYSGKAYKKEGKWYRKVEWVKKVLTGDEAYALETSDIYKRFNLGITDIVNIQARNTNVKSNYFKSTVDNGYSVIMAYENRALFYPTSDITTIDEFKAMLKEKYNSGKPVYIVYKLATPTIEEITDTTLISQLEELQKAHSYYEVTNINSYGSEDVADLVLSGKYYVSNKFRIENLEKAILSLGGNI